MMTGAKPNATIQNGRRFDPVAAGPVASFAPPYHQGSKLFIAPGVAPEAKARREIMDCERATAHSRRSNALLLPKYATAVSWRGEQFSPQEGVSSCGQFFSPLRWGFAQPCQPAATPRANRSPLVPVRAPLARLYWGGICSPAQLSALRPISSTARKTQAVARANTASVSLICPPNRVATDIHANAAEGARAPLRRFAFRHTKEQGTANV